MENEYHHLLLNIKLTGDTDFGFDTNLVAELKSQPWYDMARQVHPSLRSTTPSIRAALKEKIRMNKKGLEHRKITHAMLRNGRKQSSQSPTKTGKSSASHDSTGSTGSVSSENTGGKRKLPNGATKAQATTKSKQSSNVAVDCNDDNNKNDTSAAVNDQKKTVPCTYATLLAKSTDAIQQTDPSASFTNKTAHSEQAESTKGIATGPSSPCKIIGNLKHKFQNSAAVYHSRRNEPGTLTSPLPYRRSENSFPRIRMHAPQLHSAFSSQEPSIMNLPSDSVSNQSNAPMTTASPSLYDHDSFNNRNNSITADTTWSHQNPPHHSHLLPSFHMNFNAQPYLRCGSPVPSFRSCSPAPSLRGRSPTTSMRSWTNNDRSFPPPALQRSASAILVPKHPQMFHHLHPSSNATIAPNPTMTANIFVPSSPTPYYPIASLPQSPACFSPMTQVGRPMLHHSMPSQSSPNLPPFPPSVPFSPAQYPHFGHPTYEFNNSYAPVPLHLQYPMNSFGNTSPSCTRHFGGNEYGTMAQEEHVREGMRPTLTVTTNGQHPVKIVAQSSPNTNTPKVAATNIPVPTSSPTQGAPSPIASDLVHHTPQSTASRTIQPHRDTAPPPAPSKSTGSSDSNSENPPTMYPPEKSNNPAYYFQNWFRQIW